MYFINTQTTLSSRELKRSWLAEICARVSLLYYVTGFSQREVISRQKKIARLRREKSCTTPNGRHFEEGKKRWKWNLKGVGNSTNWSYLQNTSCMYAVYHVDTVYLHAHKTSLEEFAKFVNTLLDCSFSVISTYNCSRQNIWYNQFGQ